MSRQNQIASNEVFTWITLSMVTFFWGANMVMIKYLTEVMNPLQMGAFRIAVATLLLIPLVMWKRRGHSIFKLHHKAILPIIFIGSFSIIGHQWSLIKGLTITDSSVAGMIMGLNPLTTALLAAMFLKEAISVKKLAGIGFGFFGVMIIISREGLQFDSFSVGDFWLLLAMLTYVIGAMFVRIAVQFADTFSITAYSHLFGSIGLLVLWGVSKGEGIPYFPTELPSTWAISVFMFSAIFPTALSNIWWNNGIRKIGVSRAAMFLNGLPLSSVICAFIFLGESITWLHLASLVFVSLGIYLGTRPPKLNKIVGG